MFADPRRSVILLVHPGRVALGGLASSWDAVASLVARAHGMFAVRCYLVGEHGDRLVRGALGSIPLLNVDPLSLWSEGSAVRSEAMAGADTIFIGGLWLDEDVLIATLAAARSGYDVRVLADLSVPRMESDRQLAYDRMALHGIPVTTFPQILLEWAVTSGDRTAIEAVRNLLNEWHLQNKGRIQNNGRPGGLS